MIKRFFGLALVLGLIFGGCKKEEITPFVQDDMTLNLKNGDIIQGKYIVVYKDLPSIKSGLQCTYDERVDVMRRPSETIFKESGISPEAIELAYSGTILGVSAKLTDSELSVLQKDDRIDYIEPDRFVMLAKPGGGTTTPPAQVVPWGITRVGYATYTGTKKAWVIDTGIDLTHPDLNVNTTLSVTYIARTTPNDDNGHGRHVAGTIAAINNTIGVVGVAAGAQLVSFKVLDRRGSGAYSGVIAGVDYVAATAASGDVANMSLGGPISTALDDAILAAANKGIKFALAAGNESTDANNSSPAHINHANIFTISAMNNLDAWASFSNYGNPPVDFCAPGVSIYSTWKGGAYNTISGTSMASPHAAGVLMWGNPSTNGYVTGDPDGTPDPIIHK